MDDGRLKRLEIITSIQKARKSKVITYICGDRPGPNTQAQIGEDAVRPLYDHLLGVSDYGTLPQVDLFLYSRGGAVDVPWRVVSMIRAFASRFCVLVPFRAHSAATLLALGADEIVLGRKGELGPIDPILSIQRQGTEGTAVQEQINVEDVMAYLKFAKERGGISDQSGLVAALGALNQTPGPLLLGNMYRTHSHIRSVAAKMLESRADALEEQKSNFIIETLAEKTYAHGHAIGRSEAQEIGLPIMEEDAAVERRMWDLYLCYEEELDLLDPIEPVSFLQGANKRRIPQTTAVVESEWGLTTYSGELEIEVQRKWPPQLQVNMNLSVPMAQPVPSMPPAGQSPESGDAGATGGEGGPVAAPGTPPQDEVLRAIIAQLQQQLPVLVQGLVEQEIARQAPVIGFKSTAIGMRWSQQPDATPRATAETVLATK